MSPGVLPPHLIESYRFYKSGTKTFIQWLTKQDTAMGSRDHVQTVKELKLYANTATENDAKIPLHILEILEGVIDDRTRVHDFFKKQANPNDQDATSSHAYFTNVLLEIHGDLKALIDVPLKSPKPQAKALPLPFNNIFDRLSLHECTGNHEKLLPTGCECKTNFGVKQKNVPSTNSEEIEEDAIGHYVAISIFLSELDQLVALITEIWKKAAVGQVPTIVAASITHLAHKCTYYLIRDMDEYGIYDADELMARYEFAVESLKLCGPLPARAHLANAESRMGESLQESWHVIRDFKKDWRSGTPLNSTGVVAPFDDPWKFFQPIVDSQDPRESEMKANREIFETLFRRMGQKFEIDLPPSQAYVLTSPLLHEFQAFLDRDSRISQRRTAEHKEPETLSLAFGFQLLLQSSRAFYSPQGESSLIPKLNCRIQSLQLAGDLERHIQHLMDGQEPPCSCLKIGLQKIRPVVIWMQQSLGSIRKTKSFDLYSQAPWISGQHMASFLSSSSNLGSKIWHHGYYVGIVLHTYNALLQLEVISPDQFPVLERLCDIFKGPLFNGQRPSRNLLSCCQVWSGATIYFDKERCDGAHGQHRHRSDRKTKKWELRHKEDLSKGGNDPRRCFDPAQISLFHLLASCGYLVDRTVLARIYCSKPSEKITEKDYREADAKFNDEPSIAKFIERCQDAVLKEFQGDFPVARINYFAVYSLCVEILQRMTTSGHQPETVCTCYLAPFLRAVDEYVEDGHVVKTFKERHMLRHMKDDLTEVMKNKTLSDFLWET